MKTKTFDCVEMMHRGADKIMEEIKGMTREQQLAYWETETEELRKLQSRLKTVPNPSEKAVSR